MSNHENEETLTGRNVSNIVRTGDTVRLELKPQRTKIHKLLKHLENKGFNHAPKFLGIDEKGSFLECYGKKVEEIMRWRWYCCDWKGYVQPLKERPWKAIWLFRK